MLLTLSVINHASSDFTKRSSHRRAIAASGLHKGVAIRARPPRGFENDAGPRWSTSSASVVFQCSAGIGSLQAQRTNSNPRKGDKKGFRALTVKYLRNNAIDRIMKRAFLTEVKPGTGLGTGKSVTVHGYEVLGQIVRSCRIVVSAEHADPCP